MSFDSINGVSHRSPTSEISSQKATDAVAQTLHNPIGEQAIDAMVPEETQEVTACLPEANSKSVISQLDGPGMEAPAEDASSKVPEISQPCVNLTEAPSTEIPLNVEEASVREESNRTSHDADTIMDQEFPGELAFPFPDPASTLEIQGLPRSDQGAQGSCSLPSTLEQLTSRAASSGGGSTINVSANTSVPNNSMEQNPQSHFPLFSDPYDYELDKLRREEENLNKNFEEKTSELLVELERKMAEADSEYEKQSQVIDAAYNAEVVEQEAIRKFVGMSSLLANAFVFKCSEKSATTDVAATRAARGIQHLVQQQQAVQTNPQVNSTAPPQPSVIVAEAPVPNSSGPLSQFQHSVMAQPTPRSQQAVHLNTLMNSTAPPRPSVTTTEASTPIPSAPRSHSPQCNTTQPSVTAAETPIPIPSGPLSHFPRCTTTQPRATSQQAAGQPNTHINSLRCNTSQPRPPPIISNLTPSSSQPVHGIVRAPAPHLQSFRSSRAPNSAAATTTTTYPRRLVQEEQQQQGNSHSGLVYLSDDEK